MANILQSNISLHLNKLFSIALYIFMFKFCLFKQNCIILPTLTILFYFWFAKVLKDTVCLINMNAAPSCIFVFSRSNTMTMVENRCCIWILQSAILDLFFFILQFGVISYTININCIRLRCIGCFLNQYIAYKINPVSWWLV